MAEGSIDDEQEGFIEGRVCVDQIFTLKQIGEGEKARNKKHRMYVGFIDLGNIKALSQVLRMYDVGGKLLSGIKCNVESFACVRVKVSENERFRIDSGVTQGCIISPWLFNACMDGVRKAVKMGMGRRIVSFMENGREWRLPGLLYADDLILYGELD